MIKDIINKVSELDSRYLNIEIPELILHPEIVNEINKAVKKVCPDFELVYEYSSKTGVYFVYVLDSESKLSPLSACSVSSNPLDALKILKDTDISVVNRSVDLMKKLKNLAKNSGYTIKATEDSHTTYIYEDTKCISINRCISLIDYSKHKVFSTLSLALSNKSYFKALVNANGSINIVENCVKLEGQTYFLKTNGCTIDVNRNQVTDRNILNRINTKLGLFV